MTPAQISRKVLTSLAGILVLASWAGCGPKKLYSGPDLPPDRIATVRASGIHRLEKVDKRKVSGHTFALAPGRHLLEFNSSSRDRIAGTTFPLYSVDCYADVELNPDRVYELQGQFEQITPEVSVHDGLNWLFYRLEAKFVETPDGEEIAGLICPNACRAVGRAGSRHSWMRCDKYLDAVAGATVAEPGGEDAPSLPEVGDRVSSECKRRGRQRKDDAPCVLKLMIGLITAKLDDGEILVFVPRRPDDLLPDSKEKAVQDCKPLRARALLETCLSDPRVDVASLAPNSSRCARLSSSIRNRNLDVATNLAREVLVDFAVTDALRALRFPYTEWREPSRSSSQPCASRCPMRSRRFTRQRASAVRESPRYRRSPRAPGSDFLPAPARRLHGDSLSPRRASHLGYSHRATPRRMRCNLRAPS